MRRVLTILGKELTIFFRDKRTIFTTFFLPIIFYFIMFNVMTSIALKTKKEIENKTVKVGYTLNVPDKIVSYIKKNSENISLVKVSGFDSEKELKKKKLDSIIDFSKNTLFIYHNKAKRLSREAEKRVSKLLEDYKKQVISEKLKELNIPESIVNPFEIESKNIASEKDMGLAVLGRIMPYLIIIMLFSGALGFGLEVSTGEKEKGTIATLLVSQASRTEIVLGKLFYVIVIEILYSISNIVGFVIAAKSFASKTIAEMPKEAIEQAVKEAGTHSTSFIIGIKSSIMLFALIIPIGIISAALIIAIGSYAKSMKEGQTLMTPAILVIIFIAILTINAPIQIPQYYYYIPVLNTAFVMQEILLGKTVFTHFLLAMSTTLFLAVLLIMLSIYLYNKEEILFRV